MNSSLTHVSLKAIGPHKIIVSDTIRKVSFFEVGVVFEVSYYGCELGGFLCAQAMPSDSVYFLLSFDLDVVSIMSVCMPLCSLPL